MGSFIVVSPKFFVTVHLSKKYTVELVQFFEIFDKEIPKSSPGGRDWGRFAAQLVDGAQYALLQAFHMPEAVFFGYVIYFDYWHSASI